MVIDPLGNVRLKIQCKAIPSTSVGITKVPEVLMAPDRLTNPVYVDPTPPVMEPKIVMGSPLSKVIGFDVGAEGIVIKLLIIQKTIMQKAIMGIEIIDLFIVSDFNG